VTLAGARPSSLHPGAAPSPAQPAAATLAQRLAGTPYDSYVYAYPHKTAYGPLAPARRLEDVWRDEDKSALFLYLHVPFCEMRCGFCNLFTTPKPAADIVTRYVSVLERQARRATHALGPRASYARFAMGGGTPTLLEADGLARVLDIAERVMGADLSRIPGSVETSPETCLPDRMKVLFDRGVDRVSIGIQSFLETESSSVNRPQKNTEVFAALDAIRAAGFPVLNVDLIYGLPDQSLATWEHSLRTALEWHPEELYLYPLYVRPVTTLSRRRRDWDDDRLAMYRFARELLGGAGYEQVSMRMFRKKLGNDAARGANAPVYCVQDDGMVGLGPGARSYTRRLHYSTEWAVGARGVREILGAWLDASDDDFDLAHWGFELNGDEQRRRWVAYSLFVADGLDVRRYGDRFGADLFADLPFLADLLTTGAASRTNDVITLTTLGVERSDTIGPWLYSDAVLTKMRGFDLR
jgi:oxygen-independent coproporphyrinogen-3 oxidase